MKRVEGIIIKLIIIQFAFLLFFQLVFHRGDSFLELKRMAQYEGVYRDHHPKVQEVLEYRLRKAE
ncbi:MAG: DUF5359 family protein [Bacillus sp. (in: firmicutes)]